MLTNIEKYALALFKDYTFLQLKGFVATGVELPESERIIIDTAIDYYRYYNSIKLKENEKIRED